MTRTWLQPYSMLMTMATIYMILLRRLCLLKKLTRTFWSGYCSPNMSGWVAARQWRPCLFSQFTLDYPHLQQTSNQTLLSRNMDFSAPNTALVVRQDEYPEYPSWTYWPFEAAKHPNCRYTGLQMVKNANLSNRISWSEIVNEGRSSWE